MRDRLKGRVRGSGEEAGGRWEKERVKGMGKRGGKEDGEDKGSKEVFKKMLFWKISL